MNKPLSPRNREFLKADHRVRRPWFPTRRVRVVYFSRTDLLSAMVEFGPGSSQEATFSE